MKVEFHSSGIPVSAPSTVLPTNLPTFPLIFCTVFDLFSAFATLFVPLAAVPSARIANSVLAPSHLDSP